MNNALIHKRQLKNYLWLVSNTNKNYLCAYFQFANSFPASQAHVSCMVIQITLRFQELCCQLLCMLCLLTYFQHISARHSHAELIVIQIKWGAVPLMKWNTVHVRFWEKKCRSWSCAIICASYILWVIFSDRQCFSVHPTCIIPCRHVSYLLRFCSSLQCSIGIDVVKY